MVPSTSARTGIPAGIEIEGHAIVSADGMIADADGVMPPGLRIEQDRDRFQHALDRSELVVLGRLGHRRHPNSGRNRVVFTASVPSIARDPEDPGALFFNPAGVAFGELLEWLQLRSGIIAVTGGTRIFGYFGPLFHRFNLAEAHAVVVPDGRPCFAGGHPRIALARFGLTPRSFEIIDAAAKVTLTQWARSPAPADLPSADLPMVQSSGAAS